MRPEDLRIVVLKCPYANWDDTEARDLFTKMISLKLKGYQSRYRFGVMPVDGTDFVTDHILICKPVGRELVPLLGAKSLGVDICETFHLEFTPEAFFRKAGNPTQLEALQGVLNDLRAKDRRASYFSSWTMDLDVKKDAELTRFLKDLFVAAGVGTFREEGITDLFGIGLPKFKTDTYFFEWGFERLEHRGAPAPNFVLPNFGNLDAVLMHLKAFSPRANQLVERFTREWETRLTVGNSVRTMVNEAQKAAS